MKKILTFSGLIAILAIGLIAAGDALTQTGTTSLFVSNNCQMSITVSQIVWFNGSSPIKFELKFPAQSIPSGQTVEFPFSGDSTPTSAQVTGTEGSTPYTLTVEANGTAKGECASVSMRVAGQTTTRPTTEPTEGNVPVPSELSGLQGMTAQQVLNTLQARGFEVNVQGSEASPKVGDVGDPILLGALSSGFQASAVFVSAPGQLRAAVTYDQPNANVVMIVIGGGFCLSLSPTFVGVGGLSVSCDRPAIMAPFTTVGGGPVAGFVFLVLTIKLGGPTLPYVLSLSA